LAAQAGHIEVAKLLLDAAPKLATDEGLAKDKAGETPLHYAAQRGHIEVVKLLLDAALKLATDEGLAKDNYGKTPLHLAAQAGHIEVAKVIAEKMPKSLLEEAKKTITDGEVLKIIDDELKKENRSADS
jgi:ankyrin repeat protein